MTEFVSKSKPNYSRIIFYLDEQGDFFQEYILILSMTYFVVHWEMSRYTNVLIVKVKFANINT